mmetsp:Transcript_58168/g.147674  ORF Transcript_58168/g.147674 Transcript_58168/m.147674 type:complete len:254 (+) Transcript_58168:52-813(+)
MTHRAPCAAPAGRMQHKKTTSVQHCHWQHEHFNPDRPSRAPGAPHARPPWLEAAHLELLLAVLSLDEPALVPLNRRAACSVPAAATLGAVGAAAPPCTGVRCHCCPEERNGPATGRTAAAPTAAAVEARGTRFATPPSAAASCCCSWPKALDAWAARCSTSASSCWRAFNCSCTRFVVLLSCSKTTGVIAATAGFAGSTAPESSKAMSISVAGSRAGSTACSRLRRPAASREPRPAKNACKSSDEAAHSVQHA